MERKVREIKQKPKKISKKRVAAYARVSSGKDAMLHSLSAQVDYYRNMITQNSNWEFAGIYADEAYTGTKNSRPQFQRMLTNCRNGNIDMVITKSISRFARNTVTLLETVRELKALNVDVYFEKENLHSIGGDGELMLTILASVAEAESKSVSDNCKWRIQQKFQNGELANWRFMYGYRITKGIVEIEPTEAEIVKKIFSDYINGVGCTKIAEELSKNGVETCLGGKWTEKSVCNILKNEKYTGNALLQKRYVKDYLSKALIKNNGELPKFYAEGTHPAIIDNETFAKVQKMLADSNEKFKSKKTANEVYPFTGILKCGICGKNYRRKQNHGSVNWCCATYLREGKEACPSKAIPEQTLLDLSAKVLGVDEFNEQVFKQKIAGLYIPQANKITFIFKNGDKETLVWKDRSRSESWTDEMREQARQRRINACQK